MQLAKLFHILILLTTFNVICFEEAYDKIIVIKEQHETTTIYKCFTFINTGSIHIEIASSIQHCKNGQENYEYSLYDDYAYYPKDSDNSDTDSDVSLEDYFDCLAYSKDSDAKIRFQEIQNIYSKLTTVFFNNNTTEIKYSNCVEKVTLEDFEAMNKDFKFY